MPQPRRKASGAKYWRPIGMGGLGEDEPEGPSAREREQLLEHVRARGAMSETTIREQARSEAERLAVSFYTAMAPVEQSRESSGVDVLIVPRAR
jgi:hypothetical protein